jgi:aryl-alcohol dehydrogenase-like predicted oxidoreductase
MRRNLGRSGIEVSAMGLGCWAIGGPAWRGDTPVGWGKVDDQESIRAIHRALELGVTFLDTADVYGCGHSERILGRALSGRRDGVVIATKFSNVFDEEKKQITGSDASPDYIRRACEASLRRLGTDWIDVYQFHNGGYELERAGEVRQTLEDLVAEGKIRAYGWSTDDPRRASFFAEGEHCTSVQNHLNVLNDAPEILAVCESLDLASINRGPLAMGLLTGKYGPQASLPDDDVRGANAPSWMRYFKAGKPAPEWYELLGRIREVLTTGGRTLGQGALAWIWARSAQTVPIPGFKSVEQVEQNAGAMEHGPLTADQLSQIDRVLDR